MTTSEPRLLLIVTKVPPRPLYIPVDCVVLVFGFLDAVAIRIASRTCKVWRSAVSARLLDGHWFKLLHGDFADHAKFTGSTTMALAGQGANVYHDLALADHVTSLFQELDVNLAYPFQPSGAPAPALRFEVFIAGTEAADEALHHPETKDAKSRGRPPYQARGAEGAPGPTGRTANESTSSVPVSSVPVSIAAMSIAPVCKAVSSAMDVTAAIAAAKSRGADDQAAAVAVRLRQALRLGLDHDLGDPGRPVRLADWAGVASKVCDKCFEAADLGASAMEGWGLAESVVHERTNERVVSTFATHFPHSVLARRRDAPLLRSGIADFARLAVDLGKHLAHVLRSPLLEFRPVDATGPSLV